MTVTPTNLSIDELRDGLQGRVIAPGDSDYDEARTVVAGGIDRRPAAIVRVANAADVARAVTFAREAGAELAVRSGGHSGAGHSTTDGGIVIDLRELRDIDLDVGDRRSGRSGSHGRRGRRGRDAARARHRLR